MGRLTDKLSAAGNKLAGAAKEEIGELTGNAKLEAEGQALKGKAKVQDISGSVRGAFEDKT